MRPWDVFISHAGENKPFAEALCDLLGRMGLLAFVDRVALKPGWYFTGFLSEVLIDVSLRQFEGCRDEEPILHGAVICKR